MLPSLVVSLSDFQFDSDCAALVKPAELIVVRHRSYRCALIASKYRCSSRCTASRSGCSAASAVSRTIESPGCWVAGTGDAVGPTTGSGSAAGRL